MLTHLIRLLVGTLAVAHVSACFSARNEVASATPLVTWQVQPTALVVGAGSLAQVTVTVTNSAGAAVEGLTPRLVASAGGRVVGQLAATNSWGQSIATVTCEASGNVILNIDLPSALGQTSSEQTGLLICQAPKASLSDPLTPQYVSFEGLRTVAAADSSAPTPITLIITNGAGQPLANQSVTLTALRPGDIVAPTVAVTDSQGRVMATLVAQNLGTATVVVHAGPVVSQATVQFVAGSPTVARSTWMPSAGPQAVADGQSAQSFVLQARDARGNPSPYALFRALSDGAADVLVPPSGTTDSRGQVIVALTSTLAGQRNVTVALTDGSLVAAALLVAGAPSSQHSVLSADMASQTVGLPVLLTLVAKDSQSNVIQGLDVDFSGNAPGDKLMPSSGTTDGNGILTSTFVGTTSGPYLLTANLGAYGAAAMANVQLLPSSPNSQLSTFAASPNAAAADGTSPVSLQAQLKDRFGNAVGQVPATLSATLAGVSFMPSANAMTSASGQITAGARSNRAGLSQITLTAGGISLTAEANFLVGPPSGGTSTLTASPSSGLASSGNDASNLVLTVRDQNNILLPHAPVVFAEAWPSGRLTPRRTVTDLNGMAYGTITSRQAGTLAVFASVGNVMVPTYVTYASKPMTCLNGAVYGSRPGYISFPAPSSDALPADFNQDGNLDLLIRTQRVGPAVAFGTGYGKFAPSQAVGTTSYEFRAVIADFNNDGYPDVVYGSAYESLTTLMGSASMTLIPKASTTILGGVGLCAGDINGDGNMDVVVSSQDLPGFSVLLGDGGGHLLHHADFTLPNSSIIDCQIADFDGDGSADLAVIDRALADNDIVMFWGDANHALSSNSATSVATPNISFALAVGQLNHDSLPDLVVMQQGQIFGAVVFINQGHRTFAEGSGYEFQGAVAAPSLVDFDGDGDVDIFVSYQGDGVGLLLNRGDGSFDADPPVYSGGLSNFVAAADYDRDGFIDVAYGIAFSGGITFGTGLGQLPRISTQIGGQGATFDQAIASADFDEDGQLDIVGIGSSGPAAVMFGQGNGNFINGLSIANTEMGGFFAAAKDIDGDGHTDVALVLNSAPSLLVLMGAGDGNFSPYAIPDFDVGTQGATLKLADINGDGLLDILAATQDSNLYVFVATATPGTFVASIQDAGTTGCISAEVADFNNDGLMDVAVGCQTLQVLFATSPGVFAAPQTLNTTSGHQALWPAVADLNGDGFADIITHDNGTITIYLNQQNSGFSLSNTASDSIMSNMTTDDINGDGFPDISVVGSRGLLIYPGDGHGALQSPLSYYLAYPVSQRLEAQDLNQDGKMDFLIASRAFRGLKLLSGGCSPH